ncbi:MAG: hypothetical protein JJU13_13155 [Balneolaceae bacterium]|nr:hypothetical protein [Balneolaceae bacterium]
MDFIKIHFPIVIILLFLMLILISGCDETFKPIAERESYPYSIFGLLEYPANTNWIRVSEVRNSQFLDENATIDAMVTLQHLESGQAETLKDSLVQYETGIIAFNFRSTMELEPEHTYLLKAERSDGQTSIAKVTLPPNFPDPKIEPGQPVVRLQLKGIEHLADVSVSYDVRNNRNGSIRKWTFHHTQDTLGYQLFHNPPPTDEHIVMLDIIPHWLMICRFYESQNIPYTILQSELYTASASSEWQNFSKGNSLEAQLPDIGNVENGAGYLIGIVSKTLDFELFINSFTNCWQP